jgi:transposase
MNPVRLTPQQRFRLRRQLRTTDDLGTYRRTLGLLELDRGSAVTEVAIRLGVRRRTVHGWIATYRHHPVPGSLVTHHSTGRPPEWDEDAQAILRASWDQPPDHFGYQATAWTIPLLQSHLAHWGLTGFCDATVRRQLHALGYVWKRPRYVLDPDPHRAAKMRRIRQYIKGLGPRDVVLFEDETDLLLFPPLRACWARRGEDAEVPLCGANAKRVLFGALNPSNGTRLFLERKKQGKEDFQEFLGLIHQQYRGWRVSLVLDGDSSHTAKASQRDARSFGIQLVWLPVRCPELNPMDHLWRHGKERIGANWQYESIAELVHHFLHDLEGLSVEETLRKAGVLSEDYWLKSESRMDISWGYPQTGAKSTKKGRKSRSNRG